MRAYVTGAAQMAPQDRGMGISAPPQMMGRGMPPPPGLAGGPPPGMGGPPPGVHSCVYLCAQVCSCSSRARPRTLCATSPRGRQLTNAGWGACDLSRHGRSAWHGWSSAGDGARHAAAGCVSVRVHVVSRARMDSCVMETYGCQCG